MAYEPESKRVSVGGASIQYLTGGDGPPLVWLHGSEGNLGWLPLHDELARKFTVYVPTHPGFAGSDRPAWLESFLDLSRFYLWIFQQLGLSRVTLAGHFIGGWLAAEIAVMAPHLVQRLLLVDAAGVRPPKGEIADIFLLGAEGTHQLSFFDVNQVADYERLFGRKPSPDDREAQIINREAVTRCCWKPYMHDPGLPPLLRRLHALPALLVWGREDRIVPAAAGELYRSSIDGARLELIERCGHYPHFEQPVAFRRIVAPFLGLDT